MDWLTARRRRDRLPPGLVRVHPDDLRAQAIEREQERIAARLAALGVSVDVSARRPGNDRQRGGDGAIPR